MENYCSSKPGTLQAILAAHDAARAEVGVASLKWDAAAAAYAQNYANERRADCRPVHSGGPYGENIFVGGPRESAVAAWVAQKADFDRAGNTCLNGRPCGHDTQVVWRGLFTVCSYSPRGNILGLSPF
ncbi:hypothetical protein BRADI_1g57575v3 [Brachypodium distachyon]|uniref:SCP domain-containing protein n=1 Tax=Brachypodium distachyon TaxID=15368 RepID=A0A0Q3S744_BRADI|nr:hypothetical protein BRADI_1g57575v3 [Brachypodium distachyon]